MSDPDVVVVGSGPNGLAAAITMARAGCSVLVLEAQPAIGGGARSAELTLPGFVHDVCSAIHPLARLSPFFRTVPLAEHGVEWIEPPAALAHPLDNHAAVLYRSIADTAKGLGPDSSDWERLMRPVVDNWGRLEEAILGPPRWPRHPLLYARFGLRALPSARSLIDRYFRTEPAKALFAGLAAHSMLPLERMPSAAFGTVLGAAAHLVNWPFPRGGSQRLAGSLASYLRSLGGEIAVSSPVRLLDDLPRSRAAFFDVTPRQLLQIAGSRLPDRYRKKLEQWRYGPGVFKIDWALGGPIPWKLEICGQAATVHLGGTAAEVAAAQRAPWEGKSSSTPFVLLAQQSLFDPTRAPAGMHTAWAYCHVPNGFNGDMSEAIERQVERFAPGFRERILARSVMPPAALEEHNWNLIGGDVTGGAATLAQLFLRPTWRLYRVPVPGFYLCSASTPPGGGVHGLCGYYAAQAALRDL